MRTWAPRVCRSPRANWWRSTPRCRRTPRRASATASMRCCPSTASVLLYSRGIEAPQHGLLVVQELLQGAVDLVDDGAAAPKLVQGVALGFQRRHLVAEPGTPPAMGAALRLPLGRQDGQALLVFGDHEADRG